MRILIVGAGGVGTAAVAIAAKRDFFEHIVVADYDPARVEHALAAGDGRRPVQWPPRSTPRASRPSSRSSGSTGQPTSSTPSTRGSSCPSSTAALAAGVDYLDMAMSLSRPAPGASRTRWPGSSSATSSSRRRPSGRRPGGWPWSASGVEPGLSDVFARYAAGPAVQRDRRARCPRRRQPRRRRATTSPRRSPSGRRSRSASTRRWSGRPTAAGSPRQPFSEPEIFDFPEGIGPVECVNVEHEEVLLMPRWVNAKRVTFKYGLGDEFIDVLKVLHKLGLDRTDTVHGRRRRGLARATWSPPACPTRPTLGEKMHGKTCAGTWVTGHGKDGNPRAVYLYHVVDNDWSMDGVRLTRRWSGRPRSTRSSPWSCWRDGTWSGTGCSGRRRSSRCRSWTS